MDDSVIDKPDASKSDESNTDNNKKTDSCSKDEEPTSSPSKSSDTAVDNEKDPDKDEKDTDKDEKDPDKDGKDPDKDEQQDNEQNSSTGQKSPSSKVFGDDPNDIDRLLGEPVDREIIAKSVDEEDDFEMHEPSGTPTTKKRGRKAKRKSEVTSKMNDYWHLPFLKGWRREIVVRGAVDPDETTMKVKPPAADVYYFAPTGKKLRSKVEIEKFLEREGSTLTIECFTFIKETIYKPPMEVVRSAGKSKGRASTTLGTPTLPKQKESVAKKYTPKAEHKSPKPEPLKVVLKSKPSTKHARVTSPELTQNRPLKMKSNEEKSHTTTFDDTTSVKKCPVAKKHTGKKRRMAPADYNQPAPKRDRKEPHLCGLSCKGQEGIPPSLHCEVCMCMYHPTCVNQPSGSVEGFVCSSCRGQTKPNGQPSANKSPTLIAQKNVTPATPTSKQVITGSTGEVKIVKTKPDAVPGKAAKPTVQPAKSLETVKLTLPQMNPNQIAGQLLSLPPGLALKLSMRENLTLRVHGKTFIVPPSCFVSTQDGVKVLLPPGSLPEKPNASSMMDMTMQASAGGTQILAVSDTSANLDSTKRSNGARGSGMAETTAQWKKRRNQRNNAAIFKELCYIQKLHGGNDCMIHIFEYLNLAQLLTASEVCSAWNNIAHARSLWKTVTLKTCLVTNWAACAKDLNVHKTKVLDLRGMQFGSDLEKMWQDFISCLDHISDLQRIEFGRCPAIVLHGVADKLAKLKYVKAESIVESLAQKTSGNAKVDLGKFSSCPGLECLKLRGVGGLTLPAYCFSGGLSELGNLTKLQTLCLTTLHDVPEQEFTFLDSLKSLTALEIGNCDSWSAATFTRLGKLDQLRSLRLEIGGLMEDAEIGNSLCKMKCLGTLELIRWKVGESLGTSLPKLKQLQSLSVWPEADSLPTVAAVNSNTYKAVCDMPYLKALEWGILLDSNRAVSDEAPNDGKPDQIPFMDLERLEDGANLTEPQYMTVSDLGQKLHSHLSESKIRVFKVPTKLIK